MFGKFLDVGKPGATIGLDLAKKFGVEKSHHTNRRPWNTALWGGAEKAGEFEPMMSS